MGKSVFYYKLSEKGELHFLYRNVVKIEIINKYDIILPTLSLPKFFYLST